jgi:hypothetical protein
VRPVYPACGEQLLSANYPELFTELVPDEVLAAVTPVEREIRRFSAPATRQPRNELRVLVIRMRGDPQHADSVRRRGN